MNNLIRLPALAAQALIASLTAYALLAPANVPWWAYECLAAAFAIWALISFIAEEIQWQTQAQEEAARFEAWRKAREEEQARAAEAQARQKAWDDWKAGQEQRRQNSSGKQGSGHDEADQGIGRCATLFNLDLETYTIKELKKAYHANAKATHPDAIGSRAREAEFREAQECLLKLTVYAARRR